MDVEISGLAILSDETIENADELDSQELREIAQERLREVVGEEADLSNFMVVEKEHGSILLD